MKNHFVLSCLIFACFQLGATHFKASSVEIRFQQTGPLTVSAEVVMHVLEEFSDDFRDDLQLSWGDGAVTSVTIVNGDDNDGDGVPDGETVEPGVVKLVFPGEHVYANMGRYTISVQDPNRAAGILNINFPNSVNVPFYTQSEIRLVEDFERNHSPVPLEGGGDYTIIGQNMLHLPNAFDIDDDSLVYDLITPFQGEGSPVPNYFGIGTLASIDSDKGIMLFNSELSTGTYVFAIRITSYRNGSVQDRVIREVTIFNEEVLISNNNPEVSVNTPLEVVQEVNVGDTVRFECNISDSDGQPLLLTSSSGLYDFFANPATFTVDGTTGTFEWVVRAEHIRSNPYPVVVKAKDDYAGLGSANYALVRYRVRDGAVNTEDLQASNWLLYPNPAVDQLYLRAPEAGVDLPLNYMIVNAAGQTISRGAVRSWPATISVKSLPSGTYFLNLETAGQVWAEPFVKQR